VISLAIGKYHEWDHGDGLIKLEAYARDGLIDDEIAEKIGINRKTLYEWKNKYHSIRDALKRGKEVVDIGVENSLLKRAMGYKYKETTREPVKNADTGEYELTVTKEVTKEVVPDVTAQIFWLKNRKPTEWRDRKEVENNTKLDIEDLTPLAEMLTQKDNANE